MFTVEVDNNHRERKKAMELLKVVIIQLTNSIIRLTTYYNDNNQSGTNDNTENKCI